MGMSTHKIKGEDYYQCRDVKAERDKLLEEAAKLLIRLEAAEKARDDLLEALIELADCGAEAWGEDRPCVKWARAAIAKATGEQP